MSGDDSNSDSESEQDVESPGRLLASEVNKHGELPVPKKLRKPLFRGHPNNPTTYWGYETSRNIAFLSRKWKDDPNTKLGGNKLYNLNNNSWVSIPEKIADETEIKKKNGEIVYFFSYGDVEEMGKAYILSELQAWQLLPVDELPDDGVKEVVIHEQPGFLSSVR